MYTQEFFLKYNLKGIDRDGAYGYQCMDLYNQFQFEVMGITPRGANYAKDIWNSYDQKYFTKISNTPNFVPQLGDVAVWTSTKSNPYGHVSVCTGEGDTNYFISFDQNWPIGSKCHYEKHDYFNGFVGILRPKVGQIAKPAKNISDNFNVRVDKKEAAVRKDANSNSMLTGSKILSKGDVFLAISIVDGENVSGNNKWYKSAKGNYVWSGGLTRI